jgi:hypothetical protein
MKLTEVSDIVTIRVGVRLELRTFSELPDQKKLRKQVNIPHEDKTFRNFRWDM